MKTANKKNPLLIEVTSNGQVIGSITPTEFITACLGYSNTSMFLPEMVKRFNENKERIGEPERVSIKINA